MSAQLIIEQGAAETRAALIIEDVVSRFWFGPAPADPALPPIQCGDEFTGRITAIVPNLGGAFIDIGAGVPAFLSLPKKHGLHEGAMKSCVIKVEPYGDKSARAALVDAAPMAQIGRRQAPLSPILQALNALSTEHFPSAIITNAGPAAAVLRGHGAANVTHEASAADLFEQHGASEDYDALFAHALGLKGGGRIIIDEGAALTSIDVDFGGATANDRAKDI